MKILVTGATGFVGKTLLPLLVEKGHKIIILTRDAKAAQVRLPVACKIYEWGEDLLRNEEGIEVVINLCLTNRHQVDEDFWLRFAKIGKKKHLRLRI